MPVKIDITPTIPQQATPEARLTEAQRTEAREYIRGLADRCIYNGNMQREKDAEIWQNIDIALRDDNFYAEQFIAAFNLKTDFLHWKAGYPQPGGGYTRGDKLQETVNRLRAMLQNPEEYGVMFGPQLIEDMGLVLDALPHAIANG